MCEFMTLELDWTRVHSHNCIAANKCATKRRSTTPRLASTPRRIPGPFTRVALAVLAFYLLPMGFADARSPFWPDYRPMWKDLAPFRVEHKHSRKRLASAKKNQPHNTPKGPLQIIVSIADQRISIYDNGTRIAQS